MWPPRPYGKGVGAEADAVAGIPTGSAENIRPAVAAMRRAIQIRKFPGRGIFGDAVNQRDNAAAVVFAAFDFKRKF